MGLVPGCWGLAIAEAEMNDIVATFLLWIMGEKNDGMPDDCCSIMTVPPLQCIKWDMSDVQMLEAESRLEAYMEYRNRMQEKYKDIPDLGDERAVVR